MGEERGKGEEWVLAFLFDFGRGGGAFSFRDFCRRWGREGGKRG